MTGDVIEHAAGALAAGVVMDSANALMADALDGADELVASEGASSVAGTDGLAESVPMEPSLDAPWVAIGRQPDGADGGIDPAMADADGDGDAARPVNARVSTSTHAPMAADPRGRRPDR